MSRGVRAERRDAMGREGIFVVTAEGLKLLTEQAYSQEDILQRVLEQYPEVIAGVATAESDGGGVVLIKREIAVASQEGGPKQLSMDHLFVDADAIPIFVEVKRSSDTRIRREVVAQMLDYAANGVKYWPPGELRALFEEAIDDSDMLLQERLGVDDPDEFWRDVESNLRSGNVRLLFVADHLPRELVRIIEFLNEQMSPAEVLGVELPQYVGEGLQAFVPLIVGRTSRAIDKKDARGGAFWNRETFLGAANERLDAEELALVDALLGHVDERSGRLQFGSGATPGLSGWYPIGEQERPVFLLNINAADRRAYMFIYELPKLNGVPEERLEEGYTILERIDAFRSQVADARAANYRKRPRVFLRDVAGESENHALILRAIDRIVGT